MIQEGLDKGIPISYCLVTKNRVNYQYNTSLFDTMW